MRGRSSLPCEHQAIPAFQAPQQLRSSVLLLRTIASIVEEGLALSRRASVGCAVKRSSGRGFVYFQQHESR